MSSEAIYSRLADYASELCAQSGASIDRVLLGINWTLAECSFHGVEHSTGLSFSPVNIPRNLPWSGSLAGGSANEILRWICSEDLCEVAVGLALVNAISNREDNPLLRDALPLFAPQHPHLSVFEHFAAQLSGAAVAIIGRYPGLDYYKKYFNFSCIERRPGPGDLPESAASWVLPKADWVFITASSIANRTLPQLLALSRNARVVLMGPSLPWTELWAELGVDYLAGVAVRDRDQLYRIAAEAGGTRIFEQAVQYRLLALS